MVEVMLALGISAIVMISVVTPLVFTVNRLERARADYAHANRERNAMERIFQDARGVLHNAPLQSFKLVRRDSLGLNPNDVLIMWTSGSSRSGGAMGYVVYAAMQGDIGSEAKEGLYRWVLSADVKPNELDFDKLEAEKGMLLLPEVIGLRISVLKAGEWVDEYEGMLPPALRITCKYEKTESLYESWLPVL